ncbi:MAG: DUF2235 domain-containing protein [candidate division Zixibacteria bacterium]|nr:DUF2235 domain-containing protein [candidate division Zixibacteria bacterium]
MPKNIVVFSDGTGQDGGTGFNTNVYELFGMILDRSPEQIIFYDRGVGTGARKVAGLITGLGISKNIRDCYEFIYDNFEAGDQIFLFGFSRGAATVRSLSGFIHLFGILPPSRPELIKRAYRIYKISNQEKRERKAAIFRERNHIKHWTKIRFLGVWDTVAALGLPFKSLSGLLDKIPYWRHKFHNFSLSDSVEHAVQALAIDDERKVFHPVLWEPVIRGYQTMQQVWFCGMHTDVGGGYKESGLSDIALEWMVQKAVEHGLRIYPKQDRDCHPDPNAIMHDSRKGGLAFLYRKEARSWDHAKYGKPTVHESVTLRTLNQHNAADPPYLPWIVQGDFDIEPWTHPDQWSVAPEGLRNWCRPVDPRTGSA